MLAVIIKNSRGERRTFLKIRVVITLIRERVKDNDGKKEEEEDRYVSNIGDAYDSKRYW